MKNHYPIVNAHKEWDPLEEIIAQAVFYGHLSAREFGETPVVKTPY
jgi:hypothetical protein